MAKATAKTEPRRGRDAESIKWGFAEHLKYTLGVDRYSTEDYKRFMALSYAVRDRLINQWLLTQRTHHNKGAKRVYYLSLEFLMGRAMGNNVINMGIEDEVRDAMAELGYDWEELREQETDAGLGNGGLGRLAACFLDSMATLDLPAFGYGLRYDYGIFRQGIENGFQVEHPDDWLRQGNPWEIERPDITVPVRFGGHVITVEENGRLIHKWIDAEEVQGVAYDTPIVGYGGKTVNTLRLWSARSGEEFDFQRFNDGEYVEAVADKVAAENLTKVLYPNDTLYLGKELRLKQQYLFVACSLWDILRRFKKSGKDWSELPDMAAIQLNDTHPSLAVPELMRLLMDEEGLGWDQAWDITVKTLGYTNHTLMPEALEKWPVHMLEKLLPRHLQIIYKINHDFLQEVAINFPGQAERLRTMSLIEEGDSKMIRMAYLSIVGSHSTNGVAALHTELLKERLVPEFAEMYPDRFNNKTNGITQRRFLLKANPELSKLITDTIGDEWITDFAQLKKLAPYAKDKAFQKKFLKVKEQCKIRLAETIERETGWKLDTDTLFDVQIKRIHEYKRQLLNALHIIMLYNRIRKGEDVVPRTFLIGGKAAPGYKMAKLIIKLINNLSKVINKDPAVRDKLRVYFPPNYRVSLAEKMFPATDVSEQISTSGTEASGTGNMKFMANGAITLGTLDGANIEIREEAGDENCVIFGLTATEVNDLRPTYNPYKYYEENEEIKEALDLLFSGHFNFGEPGLFDPIKELLFEKGDFYMHLADLQSYADAHRKIDELYRNRSKWAEMAILNIANAGKFSSDRTISQYAEDIWGVKPCPIEYNLDQAETLDEAKAQE
ncbi:glycogen/starch/alpha-glucan phosphorylase [Spirochaeta africana]|uniref:Alpha-1,4 glucan phosphorylase n=1 Tax=Spirochaeta africana (strain ATCC 700263 / DSM 8902 / Z-7692) TaxID=889378 RepID=H9UH00_SPIAZ|nr:glycogen/starch/alpha-glucan phosphorylase [Spirochaeta africana]AFG36793.1 glycogen/starch/alpha-glucan phosphorylase [Spirochaeta africana DSM 8902]